MSILLPLYIYPYPGVWEPLYWIANTHPTLNITAIINPCSGPCLTTLPEQPYLDEIPKLKAFPNIRTLGYVATNYSEKPIGDVLDEIRSYANWTERLGGDSYRVDGVFFDETPGLYDWQKYDYLKRVGEEVKYWEGLGERVVVHNPGVLPDHTWNYMDTADITVIFEERFINFIDGTRFNSLKQFQDITGLPKERFSVMVHSIGNIPEELLEWTAKQMKEMVGWGFASSVLDIGEYWHSFSSIFASFVSYYAAAESATEGG